MSGSERIPRNDLTLEGEIYDDEAGKRTPKALLARVRHAIAAA